MDKTFDLLKDNNMTDQHCFNKIHYSFSSLGAKVLHSGNKMDEDENYLINDEDFMDLQRHSGKLRKCIKSKQLTICNVNYIGVVVNAQPITCHNTLKSKTTTMEFFLNGAELSLNSSNSGNLNSLCLAGVVVASLPLTQEVAGLSPFTVMANIFVTEYSVNL